MNNPDDPMEHAIHKAAFLGPKGENASELERLLLEVLHDHVFWRRNFHPSDPRLIAERDKRSAAYDEMIATLRDELFQILAELKRAAPLYSPRQVAHIVSDPSLPALVGYFAGLLYNQNNVVAEVSPETVREEREYFRALARMVDYPKFIPETLAPDARARRTPYSWGHLCSGGTVANLEALWIARNIRLYPLAVRLLTKTTPQFSHFGDLPIVQANGRRAALGTLSTFQLANLPISQVTDLHLRLKERLAEAGEATARAFQDALPSVRQTGLASFLLRYNDTFPDDRARLPKVLISQAAHYCWRKNLDLVGLGANALETLPVDDRIRLDTDALAERLQACAANEQPVLAVVSICGTTEEGAIDPLHEIEAVREQVAERGISFWHHCDAAFGGFFAAMLPKDERGHFLPPEALADDHPLRADSLLPAEAYRGIAAMAETDSITIDPHKFGYVPYPAGAVLFRNYHVRDAISYAAPYLADEDTSGFGGFLGQWTLEGSRPGAAAVSCYLSQAIVPLEEDGHGRFMRHCIDANQALVGALHERFHADDSWITLRPFADPETVAFCFTLVPQRGVTSVAQLNDYTNRIWRRMTVDGREDINQYEFLMSKTEVSVRAYRHVLAPHFDEALLDDAETQDATLILLRTCLMNPFQHAWRKDGQSLTSQFADHLHDTALGEYLNHVVPPSVQTRGTRSQHVLIIENAPHASQSLTRQLQYEDYAAHLDVRGAPPQDVLSGTAPLQEADRIVLKQNPADADQTLNIAMQFLSEGTVPPQSLLLLTHADVRDRFQSALGPMGIPPVNVLASTDPARRLKELLARLYTYDTEPTPA